MDVIRSSSSRHTKEEPASYTAINVNQDFHLEEPIVVCMENYLQKVRLYTHTHALSKSPRSRNMKLLNVYITHQTHDIFKPSCVFYS